eukprot:5234472-Pyramimonas_sp.AAC.1
MLCIFLSGAVSSETRRQSGNPCPHCDDPWPSFRHIWADCPYNQAARGAVATTNRVHSSFWTSVPRVTSKSGWIVRGQAQTLSMRARMMKAACELGLHILADD